MLIAAAACELHPRALLKAVETEGGQERPARGDRPRRPSWASSACLRVVVGDEVFWGDDRLGGGGRAAS